MTARSGLAIRANPNFSGYAIGKFHDRRSIFVAAIRQERVTKEEVLAAARSEGHSSLESVHFVVLETDGSFSVIDRDAGRDCRALTALSKETTGMEISDVGPARAPQNLPARGKACLRAVSIGRPRERGRAGVGPRTLSVVAVAPVVAVAACGFSVIAKQDPGTPKSKARVLQRIVTRIGFIGGGIILERREDFHGTVTAASIRNTCAIGVAVAYARLQIAVMLAGVNLATLVALTPLTVKARRTEGAD